jgi:hypothetical protein
MNLKTARAADQSKAVTSGSTGFNRFRHHRRHRLPRYRLRRSKCTNCRMRNRRRRTSLRGPSHRRRHSSRCRIPNCRKTIHGFACRSASASSTGRAAKCRRPQFRMPSSRWSCSSLVVAGLADAGPDGAPQKKRRTVESIRRQMGQRRSLIIQVKCGTFVGDGPLRPLSLLPRER